MRHDNEHLKRRSVKMLIISNSSLAQILQI